MTLLSRLSVHNRASRRQERAGYPVSLDPGREEDFRVGKMESIDFPEYKEYPIGLPFPEYKSNSHPDH